MTNLNSQWVVGQGSFCQPILPPPPPPRTMRVGERPPTRGRNRISCFVHTGNNIVATVFNAPKWKNAAKKQKPIADSEEKDVDSRIQDRKVFKEGPNILGIEGLVTPQASGIVIFRYTSAGIVEYLLTCSLMRNGSIAHWGPLRKQRERESPSMYSETELETAKREVCERTNIEETDIAILEMSPLKVECQLPYATLNAPSGLKITSYFMAEKKGDKFVVCNDKYTWVTLQGAHDLLHSQMYDLLVKVNCRLKIETLL